MDGRWCGISQKSSEGTIVASDRSKRGGGKETDISTAVNSGPANLPTPYQITITYSDPKAGIVRGDGADWFGPLNPMAPSAPPEVSGRRFDFPSGYNLSQQPKQYEPVGFDVLRRLADSYDLLRIVIETRKDQLSTLNWNIVPRDPRTRIEGEIAERIKNVESFFLRPDKVHFWDDWLRLIMEDLLVIDAPAIYKRRTKGGQLYALEPIDGATVKCVIDDWGRTPEPPTAAYQQVLKGMPAVNYTTEDLLYRPRNRRTNKVYGYSPVEQIIMTVNIALRRQVFQLQYFTEGNIPEALIGVPETWTPDQIKQFQDWFDGILQGNTGERRRARFVPNAVGKTYIPTKDNELFGKAEEWLARVVCFALSVNAQPFVQMMNRATSESASEEADKTGIIPIKKYVKSLVDTVILDDFGYDDIQFKWLEEDDEDTERKQKRLSGYVADGLLSINEARVKMGEDPDPNPIFNKLMMKTSMGYIVIENGPIQTNAATAGDTTSQPGQTDGSAETNADEEANEATPQAKGPADPANKLAKASEEPPFADLDRPQVTKAIKRLARRIARELKKLGPQVGDAVATAVAEAGLAKAAEGEGDLDALIKAIELGLSVLETFLAEEMEEIFEDAADIMLAKLGVRVGVVNEAAVKWSAARAVELVGKDAAGGILTETTRNMMRETISTALAAGKSAEDIGKAIAESHTFSAERAGTIALTEIARANGEGSLESFRAAKAAGVKLKKSWFNLEDSCEICAANAAQGAIDIEEPFQSGDMATPGHPECRCATTPVVGE